MGDSSGTTQAESFGAVDTDNGEFQSLPGTVVGNLDERQGGALVRWHLPTKSVLWELKGAVDWVSLWASI